MPSSPAIVAALARMITRAEAALERPEALPDDVRDALKAARPTPAPVLGITGTGGAGKSSLTDELLRRWLTDREDSRVAILSVDPRASAPAARCSATASA